MREIKFRAKRLDTGEWVYGTPIFSDDGSVLMVTSHSREKTTEIEGKPFYRIHSKQVEVEPKTLGQFTGLHDKNGNEIYEGYIVKSKWGGIGEVVFEDGAFISKWESGTVSYRLCESDIVNRQLEVIGNVYEHPELLDNHPHHD